MSDAPASPTAPKLNPDQVAVTVTPMNGGAPMHFHVKRHHKVVKLRNKLADIYGIDVNAFRWGPFDSCASASLCWEAEVLRNEQLTFATIPNIEEDDLQEGLKLEMRAEQQGGA